MNLNSTITDFSQNEPSQKNIYHSIKLYIHKWLLVLRSEDILTSGSMLIEKTCEMAQKLSIERFKLRDDRYIMGRI